MENITIPKSEYKKMLRKQVNLQSQILNLRDFVIEAIRNEEVKPSTIRRMEKISRSMDKGNKKAINSLSSLKTYFKNL